MIARSRWRAALVCALAACGVARAEPQKPATSAPAPAAQTTPPKPAPPPAAAQAPAQKPVQKPAPPPQAAPGALSESKYLSLLYAEIARHTPEENAAGPGEVVASFVVGPAGRVAKVTIDRTSSPAHAEIVKKILSEVVTPPPPGGSMDVGQTFKFR
jgi:outer membrane biosynthesis protein TonB